MGLGAIGKYLHGEWVNHYYGFFGRLSQLFGQTFGITGNSLWMKHSTFKTELDVLGGERFSVMEGQAFFKFECPTIAVGINPPFFGDAWAYPAVLGFVVKTQQSVIDRRLILGMPCPALQNGICYFCSEVFKTHGQCTARPS